MNHPKSYLVIFLSLIYTISPLAMADDSSYKALPGNFKVTGKGAASYTIPIEVVPSKYAPQLDISYNSASPGGFMGDGWGISGIPTIELCSKNARQDAKKWANLSINISSTDYANNRFCITGSRLSVIHGAYGADGSTYQTELVAQQRITSLGSCGDGPCSFRLENNDGSVHIFGGSEQSTVRLENKDILTWGISSSTDISGNEIEYIYKASTTSNVLFPDNIRYFFNADKSAYRQVIFGYDSRTTSQIPVKRVGLGGYGHQPALILSSISTKDYNGTPVLTYNIDSSYQSDVGHYQITKVQKVSADGNLSSTPTTFQYKRFQKTNPTFSAKRTGGLNGSDNFFGVKLIVMDKYGDGYNGVGAISSTYTGTDSAENGGYGSAIFTFARGDKDGNLTDATDRMDLGSFSPTANFTDAYQYLSFDKNGDGINDLIKIDMGSDTRSLARTYLSVAGKANFTQGKRDTSLLEDYYTAAGKVRSSYTSSDVNGDGLTDLVQVTAGTEFYTVTAFYSDAKGGFPTHEVISNTITEAVTITTDGNINFVDQDGDTLRDIFLVARQNNELLAGALYNRQGSFLTAGSRGTFANLGSTGDWQDITPYRYLDFNQDGLLDLIVFPHTMNREINGHIYMNSGNLFSSMLVGPGAGFNTTEIFAALSSTADPELIRTITFGDLNGDTFPDLLLYHGGKGDPTAQNSYFSYLPHERNTFGNSINLPALGAHTRNSITTMGNSSVASIVSLEISSTGSTAKVLVSSSEQFQPEVIGIDNGTGVKYEINYERNAPLIDYTHLKQPEYPNVLLSKIRTVVMSYTKSKDSGEPYGYSREHTFEYILPVYNRLDWKFAGYRVVTEKVPSLNRKITRNYYTTYPIRGRVSSTTTALLDTGAILDKSETTYKFIDKHPLALPKVVLVHKDMSSSTTYEGESADNPTVAWKSSVVNVVDDSWGFNLSSAKNVEGSPDTLYTCNRYENITTATKFQIGRPTGVLVTSSKEQCLAFRGVKAYDAAFTPNSSDFTLSAMKYDAVGRPTVKLLYSSQHSAYSTSKTVYDAKGYVTSTSISPDYTSISGIFPTTSNVKTTTYTRDSGGYANKIEVTGLTTNYETDSKFGVITKETLPNGKVISYTLDALGTKIATFWGSDKINDVSFQISGGDKFTEVTSYVGNKESIKKEFRDGFGAIWKITKKVDGNRVITGGESDRNRESGLVDTIYGNYFSNRVSSLITYDDRWLRNSTTWEGGKVSTKYVRTYSKGEKKTVTQSLDPRGLVSDGSTISVGTKLENVVTRITTHTKPGAETSTITNDLLGRRVSTVDFRGLRTTTKYDMDGSVYELSSPDGGVEKSIWDAMGNVVQTERGIEKITYQYDKIGRMTKKTRSEGTAAAPRVVDYSWSTPRTGNFNLGYLTKIEDSGTIRQFGYDQNGLKVDEIWTIDGVDYDYKFAYGVGGTATSISYPDKSTVDYTYLDTGEVGTLKYSPAPTSLFNSLVSLLFGANDGLITFSDYDINGHASTIKYSDTMTITETVDRFGRSNKNTLLNGTTVLSSMQYEWGNANKIISQTRDSDPYRYTYDIEGRLVSYSTSQFHTLYSYDASNNIVKKGDSTFVIDSASNRPVSGVISGKAITFTYDSLGRLQGDGVETYTYGSSGKLSKITNPTSGDTDIRYFNNNKLSDTNKGNTRTYLPAGYEHLGTGKGSTKRIMMGSRTLLTVNPDETLRFLFSDRLGSNLMMVDTETREPTSSYEYFPYGEAHDIK